MAMLAKHCKKGNLKLNYSCCNAVIKYLVKNNYHHSRNILYYVQRQEQFENLWKEHKTAQQQLQKIDAYESIIKKDTEIYTCNWPSDKILGIQDNVPVCRGGLIKCNNGFSNIFQHHLELKVLQKMLKQASVEQKQNIRTIFTQTKLAQQEQVKKDEHIEQPSPTTPQNSPTPQSDFANNSTDQLTRRQKLQRAVKEYGTTVMVFHITISLMSLGAFYAAVSSGIDMVSIMSYLGVGDKIQQSQLAAGASTFVVAYAIHKVFAPVRIGITLSATPLIVRYLRLKGILKP